MLALKAKYGKIAEKEEGKTGAPEEQNSDEMIVG
jgi:hypothetical protein